MRKIPSNQYNQPEETDIKTTTPPGRKKPFQVSGGCAGNGFAMLAFAIIREE